jgi:PDZ domain-containing protein
VRKAILLSGLAILIAAALVVPLPVVELSPGPAVDVPPLVRVDRPTRAVKGRLLLLTVEVSQPSAAGLLRALVTPHHELVPGQEVIPPGVDPRTFERAERRVFDESARQAAAVALQAAGLPVRVTGGGVDVAAVIPGGPSDGVLEAGDVITAVDGRATHLVADVAADSAQVPAGQSVTLEVKRHHTLRKLVVTLEPVGSLGRAGLGVAIRTLDPKIALPFPVRVDAGDIGGPSAGLMMALSGYDLVGPTDLTRGRVVAGTGTIDVAGNVGPIGGIAEKVVAAQRAGATVFLAPASQAAAARAAAAPGLRVVPIRTFADAVTALGS